MWKKHSRALGVLNRQISYWKYAFDRTKLTIGGTSNPSARHSIINQLSHRDNRFIWQKFVKFYHRALFEPGGCRCLSMVKYCNCLQKLMSILYLDWNSTSQKVCLSNIQLPFCITMRVPNDHNPVCMSTISHLSIMNIKHRINTVSMTH